MGTHLYSLSQVQSAVRITPNNRKSWINMYLIPSICPRQLRIRDREHLDINATHCQSKLVLSLGGSLLSMSRLSSTKRNRFSVTTKTDSQALWLHSRQEEGRRSTPPSWSIRKVMSKSQVMMKILDMRKMIPTSERRDTARRISDRRN